MSGASYAPDMTDSRPELIPLYKHHALIGYALVDPENAEYLRRGRWSLSSQGYAVTSTPQYFDGLTFMHRVVTRAQKGKVVDHINHIRVDNRLSNLRECTQAENNKNRRSLHSKSGLRGVRLHNDGVRWAAYISLPSKKLLSLGQYATPKLAAYAYDAAARKIHGPTAFLNFPEVSMFEDVDWIARNEYNARAAEERRKIYGQVGRMSNEAAVQVRERAAQGETVPDLATAFGVSETAINRIINRITYKKV